MTRPLLIRDLGLVAYDVAYEEQKQLVAAKKADADLPDYLLLLEHPDVYTYGRKSKLEEIPGNGVEIERRGQVTYHNPGQLVGYPILRLNLATVITVTCVLSKTNLSLRSPSLELFRID
ncbi:MAG: hypothetical protein R3B54_08640 [Bdellovibrionota bacterium]